MIESINQKFFCILTLFLSLGITSFIIPKLNSISRKYKLIDQPNNRTQHDKPVVRLGGIAIFIGFILSIIFLWSIGGFHYLINNEIKYILIIIIGSTISFIIGLTDDLFKLKPIARLAIQFLTAYGCWINGLKIEAINISWISDGLHIMILPDFVSLIITIVWITGIINAINWMDGLDGLATGIVIIVSIALLLLLAKNNHYGLFLILISVLGSSIGFLRYNTYPSKIMMGDGGSYFFGFIISTLSIYATLDNEFVSNFHISFLILFVPIADMTYVIIKRLSEKRSPFFPDRKHLHHRILNYGINERNTVYIIYIFTQIFVILSLVISNTISPFYIFISIIFSIISITMILIKNMII